MNNKLENSNNPIDLANHTLTVIEYLGNFIAPYLDGSLKAASRLLEDKLNYTRSINQVKYLEKINIQLKKHKLTDLAPNSVPLKIALPIFSNAFLEDNDFLQKKWAEMLINSAYFSNTEVNVSYIRILESLSYTDVTFLEKIYSLSVKNMNNTPIDTYNLPSNLTFSEKRDASTKLDSSIEISLQNLSRLYLIRGSFTVGGYFHYGRIYQTKLGKAFYNSCTIKTN